jgi:CheY-like chemotaxis protein
MKLKEVLLIDLLYTRIVLQSNQVAEQVRSFELAQEALAFLQQPEAQGVEAVLLDINMPEMNGFEFLEAYEPLYLRRQVQAVVVMLTSSPHPADRARAMAYTCVKHYIVKPLSPSAARGLAEIARAGQATPPPPEG